MIGLGRVFLCISGGLQSTLRVSVAFSTRHARLFCNSKLDSVEENGNITKSVDVIDRDGIECTVKGTVGENVMSVAHRNDIDIEGACEGSLACCTCHVYVEEPHFSLLPPPDEVEEDLLDMAPFLAENSRLSCQIKLCKELDGMTVRLPMGTRNLRVDDKEGNR